MMNARWMNIAVVTALGLATAAGCGTTTADVATDRPTIPADPRDTLLDGVPDAQEGAYRFVVKGGTTPLSGVLDAPKKAVDITMVQVQTEPAFTMTMGARVIGEKAWLRLAFKPAVPGLPKLPKKWMALDPAKLTDKEVFSYTEDTDPGYTGQIVEHAAGLTEKSPGHFAGTTDLTAYNTDAEILDEAGLKALGAKARTVPFTAVVEAGHLTSLTLAIPAFGKTKAQRYAVSYSGFGRTPTPTVPAAGEQQKAVPEIYEFVNG